MANDKDQAQANEQDQTAEQKTGNLPDETGEARPLEQQDLGEVDKALGSEIARNRSAITALGKITLDQEERIQNLEDAVGELAGDDLDAIDVDADEDDESSDGDEDEDGEDADDAS